MRTLAKVCFRAGISICGYDNPMTALSSYIIYCSYIKLQFVHSAFSHGAST